MKSGKQSIIERRDRRKNIAQKAFEPSPEFFNRIEIRGIGRKEQELAASLLGSRNKPLLGMEESVIHYNDGTLIKCQRQ